MFQAGGFIRKLLKWRLDIYLSQVASEEEFLNVVNKSELEKKGKKQKQCSHWLWQNNNVSNFFRGENLSQNEISL